MNAYDVDEIKHDYVDRVFNFLKLRPIYNVTKPERFFIYYLILKELNDFEEIETLEWVKSQIVRGESVHRVFINLVDEDSTTILNYYKSEIEFYKESDFIEYFF